MMRSNSWRTQWLQHSWNEKWTTSIIRYLRSAPVISGTLTEHGSNVGQLSFIPDITKDLTLMVFSRNWLITLRFTLMHQFNLTANLTRNFINNEKALRETQTLHGGCSKVEPKIFSPRRIPPSRGAGWPKFNQLETVTTFTYKPSLVKIDACNFELSW